MKKILLSILVLMTFVSGYAQQQLATLSHNDSVTVFYGPTALSQAHAAAANGDIITLSSGSFNAVEITKAVSINGAGMLVDTVAGTTPTLIVGSFKIDVPEDPAHTLSMEGMVFTHYISPFCGTNMLFSKCHFRSTMRMLDRNKTQNSASFVNCITEYLNFNSGSYQIVNSVVDGSLNIDGGRFVLVNSIVKMPQIGDKVSIQNSIVWTNTGSWSAGFSSQDGVYSYNCIGINASRYQENQYYNSVAGHNLHNYNSLESVFKSYRGTLNDDMDFHLLDTIANNILGTDGTQVGIYGGPMPFDPYVRNPIIKRCKVANKTTADGKLSVEIEVVSE